MWVLLRMLSLVPFPSVGEDHLVGGFPLELPHGGEGHIDLKDLAVAQNFKVLVRLQVAHVQGQFGDNMHRCVVGEHRVTIDDMDMGKMMKRRRKEKK